MKKTFLLLLLFTSCLHASWFNWWENNPRDNANKPHIHNPLKKDVLHAPHREDYVRGKIKIKGCIFCKKIRETYNKKNFVVKRFTHHIITLNDYPYSKGHIIITPKRHVKNLHDLTPKERQELMTILCKAPEILKKTLKADGINVGINLGSAAGASIPDHLHIHMVPRYHKGNPNHSGHGFLEALGGKLIPWRLSRLCAFLKKKFGNFPKGKK